MGDVHAEILKPRNDKREYKSLVLENELRVMLISDPDTDKAAAAMNVNVGSFSDPDGLEGLAHFLEHMLFYASHKYPLEDSYSKYLTEHGGHTNAYTSSEYTNFHFDVNADYLEDALDRFAQFFVAPLMSADATGREINAVDSEHSKNLTVDVWRLDQLSRHVSSKDHPFHKFGTGSLTTLYTRPKEHGIDTRAQLLKFYEEHYSSNVMCLAVYGKDSLDRLEQLVQEKFSDVKNTKKHPPKIPGDPCLAEHLQVLAKAVPIKELHKIDLAWPITPEIKNYKAAACRYIGHLLGHEAEGSLFALLKSLGWASSLSAGEMEPSSDYAFFSVHVELTDAGQGSVDDIIAFVFQYIRLLEERGIADWIFEEIRTVCEMKFHFQDKIPPIHYTTRLASNMQLYPMEDWLAGPLLPRVFNADIIRGTIRQLSPDRVRILWSSKLFEDKTSDVEPWYGTPYSLEQISEKKLKQWRSALPDSRLHLPTPNPFIPTDFQLKAHDNLIKLNRPHLLRKSKMSRLWFKPDFSFCMPKAVVYIDMSCPQSNYSPDATVLSNMFVKLLSDYLNEYAYYAEIAGLQYNIQRTSRGFQIYVAGYDHKLAILVEKILEKITNFEVKEDRFSIIKEKLMKDYLNFKFQQPYQQAMYYHSLAIEHQRWHVDDYIEVLPSIDANALRHFLFNILSRIYCECFITGNMTMKDAEVLVENLETVLCEGSIIKTKAPFPSQHAEDRIVKLESGSDFYYATPGMNAVDENSAMQLYLQIGQDETLMNVLLELFVLIAKRDAFHQLRTVEQLGYVVVLMQRNDTGVRGTLFLIQSTVKDPEWIEDRVESFLEAFEASLEKLTDEDFKTNVQALIEIKLEKFKNLYEESGYYWKEIDHGTCKFDRQDIEVAALRDLSKEQLVSFFNRYIKRSSPERKKMSFWVFGRLHEEAYNRLQGEEIKEDDVPNAYRQVGHKTRIDNIFQFKRAQALYGSFKAR